MSSASASQAFNSPDHPPDARNIGRVAEQLAARLKQLDPANAAYYDARYTDFARRWQTALARREREAAPLKGMPVVTTAAGCISPTGWD